MSISHRTRLVVIVLALIILLSISLVIGLRKTVTLTVNGQSQSLTTYAFTVGNLLYAQGIPLSLADELSPSQDAWLKNGAQVTLRRSIPVQILSDGKLTSLYSADRIPSSFLAQAGVNLAPADLLLSNGRPVDPDRPFPDNTATISLQVIRSLSFTPNQAGQERQLTSSARTLGSALWSSGYTLFAADQLLPEPSTPLTKGLVASLQPSRLVTVHTLNADVTVRTSAVTVGQLLEASNLSPQGLDYSLPSPESPIPASGKVRLVRVTEQVLVEQTPLPFETEFQPVSDLDLDSQSIVQAGEYGLTAERVRVRYEDGQEITRTVETEWVARQPTPPRELTKE